MTRDTFKSKGTPRCGACESYRAAAIHAGEKREQVEAERDLLLEAYKQWQKLGGVEIGLIAKIEAIYPTE